VSEPARNLSEVLLPARPAPRIEALYALVVRAEGAEGVLRCDSSAGPIPWITDEPRLVPVMLELARADFGESFEVARFVRIEEELK
jgi:hypothetical protein